MKSQIWLVLASALIFTLTACGGGNSQANTVTGNWTAALSNTDGSPALAFTTTLNQNSGSSTVNVNNLSFTTTSACFPGTSTATGAFVLSGNFNGQTTGSFQLTVQSGTTMSGNLLTLQGTVNNNTVSGTWTLTGVTSGCSGSGNFTMNKM
jgi:hypothetical protein